MSLTDDEFLEQANKYLMEAQQWVLESSAPFQEMDGDEIIPTHYKEAIRLVKQTQEHIDKLYNLIETISPFPKITASNRQQNISKEQFISKIDYIVQQIEHELIPFLEDEDPQCQEIFEKLEQKFWELYPLSQAHDMKPVPNQCSSPFTPTLRNQLIEILRRVSIVATFNGRTSLLHGIPNPDILKRDDSVVLHDLQLIIDQLDGQGRLNSGDWPLLLLIDNAQPFVAGWQVEQELQDVKQALEKAYKAM